MAVPGEAGEQGLIPTTDAFGTALADIVRCGSCGHMQLERFPAEAELAEAYGEAASEDYVGEEAGQRATARVALRRIARHSQPGRLLDLGCWVGFLMAEARDAGWDPIGVEPSAFAVDYAKQRLGLDVRHEDIESAELPARTFRAVVMADVIEHLPQPGEALDRIAELLEPDGVIYLALPDAGSRLARLMGTRWWSVIPTHVHYFTRASMLRLLERHGYRVQWMGTAPKAFTVGYYLARTSGYSAGLGAVLVRVARALGLADRLWAPDFRDRMALVARAPAGPSEAPTAG
jgi:SAM-dependent methyltransferase